MPTLGIAIVRLAAVCLAALACAAPASAAELQRPARYSRRFEHSARRHGTGSASCACAKRRSHGPPSAPRGPRTGTGCSPSGGARPSGRSVARRACHACRRGSASTGSKGPGTPTPATATTAACRWTSAFSAVTAPICCDGKVWRTGGAPWSRSGLPSAPIEAAAASARGPIRLVAAVFSRRVWWNAAPSFGVR